MNHINEIKSKLKLIILIYNEMLAVNHNYNMLTS